MPFVYVRCGYYVFVMYLTPFLACQRERVCKQARQCIKCTGRCLEVGFLVFSPLKLYINGAVFCELHDIILLDVNVNEFLKCFSSVSLAHFEELKMFQKKSVEVSSVRTPYGTILSQAIDQSRTSLQQWSNILDRLCWFRSLSFPELSYTYANRCLWHRGLRNSVVLLVPREYLNLLLAMSILDSSIVIYVNKTCSQLHWCLASDEWQDTQQSLK